MSIDRQRRRISPDAFPAPLRRVVIADGDADTRSMYREALRPLRLDLIETTEGRDALVQCLLERPVLLIADTRLATIDGYELCRLLRHDGATRDLAILFVTSESRPAELTRLRHLGATGILSKPVLIDTLCEAVTRLCDGTLAPPADGESLEVTKQPASRRYRRFETTTPPHAPPALNCGVCDRVMHYQNSRVGGVSPSAMEQWDRFRCPQCAGVFEYRHRTRKLRPVT